MNLPEVELVQHSQGAEHSGIGRYTSELHRHLARHVPTRLASHLDPPFSRVVSTLHHLPVGIDGHRPGRLVHFIEDLGCSQMLWRPVHPAVATSHDLGMLAWPPEAEMHRPWDRLVWRLSYLGLTRMDAVIAPSEFSRRMLIEILHVAPERTFTVHSGVDRTRFRPVPDARRQLFARWPLARGDDERYLLYVGTEIPRKNLSTVLRAMVRLPPAVRLLKVGGPGGARFREMTRRAILDAGLEDRVVFIDDVSDEELAVLYSAADVYVCCSFLEGFGQPLLEAMASGTPVVCSNAGALPEIADEAAIVVPPNDERAVADAILAVLEQGVLRERLVARGLAQAARFDWERTAQGVLAVYREVWERHEQGRRH
jgi:glycosyltransferase involved in cell wall biosynthesis